MIKRNGIQYAVAQCLTKQIHASGFFARREQEFDPIKLLEFIKDIDVFLDKDIFVRTEGSIFSIYCNDTKLFKQICKKMSNWIQAVYEPANDAEYQYMLDNGHKKVLCNHLPFKQYQYKLHIKENINQTLKDNLWSWMAKYNGKMRVPVSVANWLTNRKRWVTNPSIYVEDGPTLSMLLLFLGDRASKIEEFVPRSLINTQSEESTCPV
jgi:hypothetical protein